MPAFVVGAPPVNDAPQRGRVLELAGPMREAASLLGVPFVDVASAVDEHRPWHAEAARDDGAHPGRDGYTFLAGLIVDPWLAWVADPGGVSR